MMALLLDHLWQSTLFVLAAGILTLLFRRNGAAVRYGLWFAASMKFFVPFALLTALGGLFFQPLAPAAALSPLFVALQPAAKPFSAATPLLAAPTASGIALVPILLGLWALGSVAIATLWLIRWSRLRANLRAATDLPLAAPLPVKSSQGQLEPGLVGVLRPVLVMPDGIAARLSQNEMDAVLAHELCHLRRHDNLTAALHMLVEALFWFHPLVWWLGARLIAERERACDESVVELGNDPETYAQGILKVCQFYLHSPLACSSGVSGADLKRRIETIMTNQMSLRLNFAKKFILATAAGIVLCAPLAMGMMGTAAVAQAVPTQEERARMLMEQAMPRTAIAYNPADFDKYVGYYQMPNGNAYFTIHRDGDHLFSRLTSQPDVEVYPESPTKFFAKVVDAQISFDTDAQGRVTSLVLHQSGMEQRANKVDEAVAKSAEAAQAARFKNQTPDPAREAPLRRFIEAAAKGTPAFDIMSPALADAVRKQQPTTDQMFKQAGAFKSLTFKGVGPGGFDIYIASFEHANQEWRIGPIGPDGKINGILFSPAP